jgi:hypothetical protein
MSQNNLQVDTRDVNASACRADPNKLSSLLNDLDNCRSTSEQQKISMFVSDNINYVQEFQQLSANYTDVYMTGNTLFGQSASDSQIKDISKRNEELKKQRDSIKKKIQSNEAIEEQMNRDFLDTKKNLPETLPTHKLHVLEDYTMAIFITGFIFMILSCVYLYTYIDNFSINSIVLGFVLAIIGTGVMLLAVFTFL